MIKIPKARYSRRTLGFSLLELLVVLAIMGLLMSLVGPQVLNQLGGAKSKTAMIQIKDFELQNRTILKYLFSLQSM